MPITVYGEANPDLKRFIVTRDAVLWRYMDIGKYLDIITTEKMWFTRVSELRKTDPYEGTLTEYDENNTTQILAAKDKATLRGIFIRCGEPGLANIVDQEPNKSIYWFQLVYLTKLPQVNMNAYTNSVSCWHENQAESDAMWALYARRDAGIAIKSTISRVLTAFDTTARSMYVAKVTYDFDG